MTKSTITSCGARIYVLVYVIVIVCLRLLKSSLCDPICFHVSPTYISHDPVHLVITFYIVS